MHPEFKSKAETIFCRNADTSVDIPSDEANIDEHLIKIEGNMVLFRYIQDIFSDNTGEGYVADSSFKPEDNAAYLYSIFCKLTDCKNYVFVSIPVTRKDIAGQRELMGGVFLVLQNNGNITDINSLDTLILKIITAFHKGLIDWQEARASIFDIDLDAWNKIREIGRELLANGDDPHHWPYGGVSDKGQNNDKTAVANAMKKKLVPIINDVEEYPELFQWKVWEKPPIRALLQLDSMANDLSHLFALLESSLSADFGLKIAFHGTSSDSRINTLWFNAVALGKALFHICEGFSQLMAEGKSLNKDKIIIEWDSVIHSAINLMIIRVHEYLDVKASELRIPFKNNCWDTSSHSLKAAHAFLRNCGVKMMVYSAYSKTDEVFKTQLITITDEGYSSAVVTITSYKKNPPFLFFCLAAEPYSGEKAALCLKAKNITDQNTIQKSAIETLFRNEYEDTSN